MYPMFGTIDSWYFCFDYRLVVAGIQVTPPPRTAIMDRQLFTAGRAMTYAGVSPGNLDDNLSVLAVPYDFIDRPRLLKPKKLTIKFL
jgi:hypothetical protein